MQAFLIILIIIGLSIVGSAVGFITIPWLKFDRQVQMERDIVTKTYNADNALYNYRWFKDQMAEIKATETKIETAESDLESFERLAGDHKNWTFEDKNEYARLSSVKTGLMNHYQDVVTEYNSRATQADRAIFQDELPLFFSIKPY